MGTLSPGSKTLCCAVVWLCAWTTACGQRNDDLERGAPTPYELTTAWAGARNQVIPYREVTVPGYELFWVNSLASYGPPAGFGVAVPVDEQNFLEGKGALRALLQRGVDDPMDMARLCLMFLERGGDPLPGARTDDYHRYGVSAPQVEDRVLSFWYERRSDTYVELLQAELMLDTLEYHTRSVHLQELQGPRSQPGVAHPLPGSHP